MKPSKHNNNPESWRRDDVNLRRALQQRNSNLPLLPEGFADRLMERLEEERTAETTATAVSAKPATSTKRRYLWPIVATALSAAAILALVFVLGRPTPSPQQTLAREEYEAAMPIVEQPETPVEEQLQAQASIAEGVPPTAKPVAPTTKPTTRPKPQPSPTLIAEETVETTIAEAEDSQEDVHDSLPELIIDEKRMNDYLAKNSSKAHNTPSISPIGEGHNETSRQQLALALNVGADFSDNSSARAEDIETVTWEETGNTTKPDNYYFFAGNGYTYDLSSSRTSLRGNRMAVGYAANNAKSINDDNHHMPVSIGVSIRYPLSQRFAIESGLIYTRLVSTFDSGTLSSYEHSRQQIHYLGIPLRAQAQLFDRRNWNIYVSLGGSVELPVSTLVTHRIITASGSESRPDTHPTAPVQFAIGGGLGVQYSITRHLGIYAEPQLQWFIPTDSNIKTYRTEHPLRFVPSVGLRWTL